MCVCEQGYAKTTGRITVRLGERMWYWSGEDPLAFGADLDQDTDYIFYFFNIVR